MPPAKFQQTDSIDSIKKRYEDKEERRVQRALERQRREQLPELCNSVGIDGSCAGFGVLLEEVGQQSQGCEPMTYSLETPVSELEIGDSIDSMVTRREAEVEDDQSAGNCTDSDREIPVPRPENTADDSADSNVASILSKPDSTASAVLTAVVEEPVAAILSADTNQAGNLDRSCPASGPKDTLAHASQTTAGRGKRSREGVEGANGTDGPRPAKRTRQEDTTTRTLRSLPSRARSVPRNGRSPGPRQTQSTRASKLRRVAPSSPKPFTSHSNRLSHKGNHLGRNSIPLLNPLNPLPVPKLGLRSRPSQRSLRTLPSTDGMSKILKALPQAQTTILHYGSLATRQACRQRYVTLMALIQNISFS
ncbi:hypothetical protein PG997_001868 [Apiospora hydei]|uniref:Uncharacterized protein n=1 Tax=Apiospora hydei TaxID=1337664 RepID=A0ABR1X7L8_9PEZI